MNNSILKKATKFALLLFLATILSSCRDNPSEQNPLTFIHLIDISKSAMDDKQFNLQSRTACLTLADNSIKGDMYTLIPVGGQRLAEYKELNNFVSIKRMKRDCNKFFNMSKKNSEEKGTFACKVWNRVQQILDTEDITTPFILSQIQVNEHDEKCNKLLIDLTKKIDHKGGLFIHANAQNVSDDPNSSSTYNYNEWIRQTIKLRYSKTVRIYQDNLAENIVKEINHLRTQ